MNKSDLIARVAERLSGDHTTAVAAVNGVLEEIEESIARGERVVLTGFGTFDRRERAPRSARNPRTGEAIVVGASVVPVFRAGTGFKALLTRADGASTAPQPAAVVGATGTSGGNGSQAAASDLPGTGVAADTGADRRKKKKEVTPDRAEGKDRKKARKAAKKKAAKKATKDLS